MNVDACEYQMSAVKVDDAAFSDASDHDDNNGDGDMDLLIGDDVAFEKSSEVQGVPYETSLLNETSDMSQKIVSVVSYCEKLGKTPLTVNIHKFRVLSMCHSYFHLLFIYVLQLFKLYHQH